MKTVVRAAIVSIFSILILSWIFPQSFTVANSLTLLMAGVVLALLQTLVQPVLKLMFLPINMLTLGVFGWVINVLMLWLAMQIVPGFEIHTIQILGFEFSGIWGLVLASFLLSLTNGVISSVF